METASSPAAVVGAAGPYRIIESSEPRRYPFFLSLRFSRTGEVFRGFRVLPSSPDEDGAHVRLRSKRNAEFLSSFDHPGIVHAVDIIDGPEGHIAVLAFGGGQVLDETLSKRGKLETGRALRIALNLLEVIEYCHSRCVLLCGIHPSALLLSGSGSLRMFDFSHALRVSRTGAVPGGIRRGRAPWIAPEQAGLIEGGVDGRADLFCVGLLLYRMLSGRHPFEVDGGSVEDTVHGALTREVIPVGQQSTLVNALLAMALSPSRAKRYQTVAGMRYDIRSALDGDNYTRRRAVSVGAFDVEAAAARARVFVGRKGEQKELRRGIKRRAAGRPARFLLYGVAGVGKTEVVRSVVDEQNDESCAVCTAKCNPFTPSRAYGVIHDCVAEFLAWINDRSPEERQEFRADFQKAVGSYSGLVCRALPEMRILFDRVGEIDSVSGEKESQRFVHVLFVCLRELFSRRPPIVFVDDVQWIDAVTFAVFRRLLETGCPGMFVLCFRTPNPGSRPVVQGIDLAGNGDFDTVMEVRPFEEGDIDDLVTRRFGQVANGQELITDIACRTDGMPVRVEVGIRYLMMKGMLRRNGGEQWVYDVSDPGEMPVAFTMASLIKVQRAALEQASREILDWACLIDGPFSVQTLSAVSGHPPESVHEYLRVVEEERIVEPLSDNTYHFAHDTIQEVLAGCVRKPRRTLMYGKLADYYEALVPTEEALVLKVAQYRLKSGEEGIYRAVAACREAARYAAQKLALEVAADFYGKALEAWKECARKGRKTGDDPAELNIEYGEVLRLAGRNEEALQVFQRLLEQEEQISEQRAIEHKYKIGSILHNLGRFDESIPYFKHTLKDLGLPFPSGRYSIVLMLLLELSRQFLWASKLTGKPKKVPGPRDVMAVAVLNRLCYSLYFEDMVAGLYANVKALNVARRLNHCAEKAETFCCHAVACYQMFMRRRAARYFEWSLAVSGYIRREDATGFSQYLCGVVSFFCARWKEVREYVHHSLAAFESIGDFTSQVQCHEPLWRTALYTGDLVEAERGCRRTISVSSRAEEKHFLVCAKAGLYLVRLLKEGQEDRGLLEEINGRVKSFRNYLTHSQVGIHLLHAEMLQGKSAQAYEHASSLAEDVLNKDFNSEYNAPVFALLCELLANEMSARKEGRETIPVSNRRVRKDFKRNMFLLWFYCRSYPAYRGAFNRCLAWYFALHSRRGLASRFFKRAITRHHALGMKYEEAKSVRDYGVYLDTFRHLPGEANDCYLRAYLLFQGCGARLETERLWDKVGGRAGGAELREQVEPFPYTRYGDPFSIRRIEDISSLFKSVEETRDPSVVRRELLRTLISLTNSEFGVIACRPRGAETGVDFPVTMAASGRDSAVISERVNHEIVNYVLAIGESLLCNGGEDTARFAVEGSVYCLRCNRESMPPACVYLANARLPGIFTDPARKLVDILVGQSAVLLENSALAEQWQAMHGEMDRRVEEHTMRLNAKNNELKHYMNRVLEAERMNRLLSNTLVHDIKNSLFGISGEIRYLRARCSTHPHIVRKFESVHQSCVDAFSLTSNLLDIARMEERTLHVSPVELGEQELGACIEKYRTMHVFVERGIRINVTMDTFNDRALVYADPALLDRVFQNLFSNASKYVPDNGTVRVHAAHGAGESEVRFFTSGPPVPEERRSILFQKFAAVQDYTSLGSKGLGLFFCRLVMEEHGGSIVYEPHENGNCFVMRFPGCPVLS